MPMPLIATDLDGTLLTTGSRMPHPDAIAAVHQAIAAGIPIVFATGRAPVDVLPIAELVGHRWFAVCNDGAAIVDLRTELVIKTHPMPQHAKTSVVQRLKLKHPEVKFLIDRVRVGAIPSNRAGLVVEEGFEAPWAWALDGAEFVTSIEDALSDPDVVKIAAYVDADGENPAVFYEIKNSTSDVATAVRIHSEKTFVDFSHFGISKATGVQELAQMHGIADADVFAVGDLHNDIEMLGWAGFSFAVANAHPAVHEVADLIVPSNDDGGVAVVIAAAMAHLRLP